MKATLLKFHFGWNLVKNNSIFYIVIILILLIFRFKIIINLKINYLKIF